jgi:hypothetical protein
LSFVNFQEKLTGTSWNFCAREARLFGLLCAWRKVQILRQQVHPAYEYWEQSDPMREVNRKVSKEEMAARVSQMYAAAIRPRLFRLKPRVPVVTR